MTHENLNLYLMIMTVVIIMMMVITFGCLTVTVNCSDVLKFCREQKCNFTLFLQTDLQNVHAITPGLKRKISLSLKK